MQNKPSLSAVVLAGGFGTRLSPLTKTKPKPLIKILDKTVLETVLSSVKRLSPGSITVSTYYMTELIEKKCREIDKNIVCKKENIPLGTAGAMKYCYDGKSDNILVVSGDAIFDIDLDEACRFHLKNDCDVTIIATRTDDPTSLGCLVCQKDGTLIEMMEKPPWKSVKSSIVSTGIYILKRQVLEQIPQRARYDFAKQLFPSLLHEGKKIMCCISDKYWCDIGKFDDYFACNMHCADGRVKSVANDGYNLRELAFCGVEASGECYVSRNAVIGKNVKVSSCVISNGCRVGDSCDITSSVIGSGSSILSGSTVFGALLGENVYVGENAIIPGGCIIGDGARIADGTVLKKYSVVMPNTHISKEDKMTNDFAKRSRIFKLDATAVFDKNESLLLLPTLALSIVRADEKKLTKKTFSVMCDATSESEKLSFLSGLLSCDCLVLVAGIGEKNMFEYSKSVLKCDYYVYLYTENDSAFVCFCNESGIPVHISTEQKISKIYSELLSGEGENNDAEIRMGKGSVDRIPLASMYKSHLLSLSKVLFGKACPERLSVFCKDELLSEILSGMGINVLTSPRAGMLNFDIKNGKAEARFTNIILDQNKLICALLKNLFFLSDPDIVLPPYTPSHIKRLLPSEKSKSEIRLDLSDPYTILISFAAILFLSGKSFEDIASSVPAFAVFEDEYLADVNRAATVEKLLSLYGSTKNHDTDGIRLQMADGNVTVIPNRAKGFRIIAESVSMEAAKELSFKVGEIIKN